VLILVGATTHMIDYEQLVDVTADRCDSLYILLSECAGVDTPGIPSRICMIRVCTDT